MMMKNMENNIVLIPDNANYQLPDNNLLNYYIDLSNRTIWLDEQIDGFTLEIIKYITRWNKEDGLAGLEKEERVPIKLMFFSPGGDMDVNYAIIDAIKLSMTPIIGINIGQCASAAAFIYLSCHKRLMLPHAYFLFHQGSGTLSGTYGEIRAQMEDYEDQVTELAQFMIKNTKYDENEILTNIAGEWYVRADEAVKKGVCDKVIENISEMY